TRRWRRRWQEWESETLPIDGGGRQRRLQAAAAAQTWTRLLLPPSGTDLWRALVAAGGNLVAATAAAFRSWNLSQTHHSDPFRDLPTGSSCLSIAADT